MVGSLYSKPPLKYDQQLKQLVERGLLIDNKERALHLLEVLSYYRLSAYLYPLLTANKTEHQFKEGSKIENAFEMYYFDRELRLLLMSEIEKIEVALRAKLIYVMSHKYDAFWYTHQGLFKDKAVHLETLGIINGDVEKSKEVFVKNYRDKYINTALPSWMALEVVTFTCLSKIYQNIGDNAAKAEISNFFGLPYQLFESWLHVISYTRNSCAHYARFWNRDFSIAAVKPNKQLAYPWISDSGVSRKRAYMYISIIKYLLDRVNPNNSLAAKLNSLFVKFDGIDILAMDFPKDWESADIWKGKN